MRRIFVVFLIYLSVAFVPSQGVLASMAQADAATSATLRDGASVSAFCSDPSCMAEQGHHPDTCEVHHVPCAPARRAAPHEAAAPMPPSLPGSRARAAPPTPPPRA